jgi:hypothetical protein
MLNTFILVLALLYLAYLRGAGAVLNVGPIGDSTSAPAAPH